MGRDINSVIIASAGLGKRFSSKIKKQFQIVADKPVLFYSLKGFQNSSFIDEIILVISKEDINTVEKEIVKKHSFTKVSKIVEGGTERQFSVRNGFSALENSTRLVIIHDAARPFINVNTIESLINEANNSGAAITAIKIKDTLKKCFEGSTEVTETLPRNNIWRSQTPQAFRYEVLSKAYKQIDITKKKITDEAQLVELIGQKVKIVEGSEFNIKITTDEDLILAESIANSGLLKNE